MPAFGINTDIPITVLSKEAFDPQISLDRQIIANLRLKNLLEEYLTIRKSARQALKGLGIPYLEDKNIESRNGDQPRLDSSKNIEQDLENLSRYRLDLLNQRLGKRQFRLINSDRDIMQVSQMLTLDAGAEDETGSVKTPDGYTRISQQNIGRSYNSEMPWIFRFSLKLLRFAYANRIEIMLWSLVGLMAVLIIALVVKK